jgi:hypothetical protein
LNANDPCLARIAAVHLKIPDLPSSAVRDALEAEDSLIKYARDEGGGSDWNPALHPRAGAPPNPGWFVPTDGEHDDASRVRIAQNNDDSPRTDAAPTADDQRVKIPPGKYIDELADFVEWIANAKPEDARTIRGEIKRYYYDVGDANGGDALNAALSSILQPGTTKEDRQAILDLIQHNARYDPAETGHLRDLLSGTVLLLLPFLVGGALPTPRTVPPEARAARTAAEPVAADEAAIRANKPSEVWGYGWGKRGQEIHKAFGDGSLPPLFRTIDKFDFATGAATSLKSIDVRAATYQDASRFMSRVNTYVDRLTEYEGGALQDVKVALSEITGRVLEIIVPKGSLTVMQRTVIEAAKVRAQTAGSYPVRIIIKEF